MGIHELTIFANLFILYLFMKHLKTIVIIMLNVLFCIITIWLFVRNSILRPYTGSLFKESLSAVLVLGSLYANYFLLYPQIYKKYSYVIYCLAVVFIALAVAVVDLAIAFPNIMLCNAQLIQHTGYYNFFSTILFFTFGRNLALNFFPYLFRERQQLRFLMEKEVQVVYREFRKLDVTDKDSNVQLVPVDDIFYCLQQHNFAIVYTVQNKRFTRLGSMKHLVQLLGKEEFVRLTKNLLVPFRYIESCQDDKVMMKQMPWEESPTIFTLDPKTSKEVVKLVREGIQNFSAVEEEEVQDDKGSQNDVTESDKGIQNPPTKTDKKRVKAKTVRRTGRRKPITPPDDKILEVLACIESHPNCHSADIIAETHFSQSTIDRCLLELRKLGMIERVGGRKYGGYCVPTPLRKTMDTEPRPKGRRR